MLTAKVTLELRQGSTVGDQLYNTCLLLSHTTGEPLDYYLDMYQEELEAEATEHLGTYEAVKLEPKGSDGWVYGELTIRKPKIRDMTFSEPDNRKHNLLVVQAITGLTEQEVLDMPLPVYEAILLNIVEVAPQALSKRG